MPPLIVALGEAIRARKLPGAGLMVAVALATAGTVMTLSGASDAGTMNWHSAALLATASFAFAAIAVAARMMSKDISPVRATGLGLSVTAAILAAVVMIDPAISLAPLRHASRGDLAVLAYIGFAATGGAYLAFVVGMKLCRSASAGMITTMIEPVLTALFAAALLGERLTGNEWFGSAMMLVAMAVLMRSEQMLARMEHLRALGTKSIRSGATVQTAPLRDPAWDTGTIVPGTAQAGGQQLRRLLGLVRGLSGVLVLFVPRINAGAGGATLGWLALAMCIPVCFAGKNILLAMSKSFKFDLIAASAIAYGAAASLLLISVTASGSIPVVNLHQPGGYETGVLVFGCFDALGTIIFVKLIRHSGPVFSGQKAYTVAVSGVVWSGLLLHEVISPSAAIALALILTGMIFVAKRPVRAQLLDPLAS